ncbi:MAG: dephospho-CoA kinase [Victivallales bacterium]|jgi:dephospho-CoA kinase|nr:dephospho-CoA kinase [Victivallales bacterium]
MILGITGAFGCGKSSVLAAFAARAWRTFDADLLCHELYAESGGVLAQKLAQRWGSDTLTATGAVDRRKVGKIVFENSAELEFLTGLIYPELSRKLDELIADCRQEHADGVFEIPLLYEVNYEKKFDCVAAIWAKANIRHDRLKAQRNFSDTEIRQREARQLSADAKLERASFALINNGGFHELELQVERLIWKLKRADGQG